MDQEIIINELGTWKLVSPNVKVLLKPSQKLLDEDIEDKKENFVKKSIYDEIAEAYYEGLGQQLNISNKELVLNLFKKLGEQDSLFL